MVSARIGPACRARPYSARSISSRRRGDRPEPRRRSRAGRCRRCPARRDEATGNWDDSGQVRWINGLPASWFGAWPDRRGADGRGGRRRSRQTLTARHAVVVATGSARPCRRFRAARPAGQAGKRPPAECPAAFAVIGGGVVACEMAMRSGLGADEVTMLVRGHRLLERMEPFAGTGRRRLQSAGSRCECAPASARFRVAAANARSPHAFCWETVEADELLMATGRPSTLTISAWRSSGSIPGSRLPWTTASGRGVDGGWLYAVGDANGRNSLTHMASTKAGSVHCHRRGLRSGGTRDFDRHCRRQPPQGISTRRRVRRSTESGPARLRRAVEYDIGSVIGALWRGLPGKAGGRDDPRFSGDVSDRGRRVSLPPRYRAAT